MLILYVHSKRATTLKLYQNGSAQKKKKKIHLECRGSDLISPMEIGLVAPAKQHDDAAAENVEPSPFLPQGSVEPPLSSSELHGLIERRFGAGKMSAELVYLRYGVWCSGMVRGKKAAGNGFYI